MRWSLKIGRLAGIDVFVHATFPLLILYVAWSYWNMYHSWDATIRGVTLVLTVFCCVVLHELGHALTARRYGIQTKDITLLPIGGVARLERMPEKPSQEFLVAIAGPAVNVLIALCLFLGLVLAGNSDVLSQLSLGQGNFAVQLLTINLFIVVFNLVPAFPMDGGRILRALLAVNMSYAKATKVAAGVGQGMALVFGFLGFTLPYPLLIFIAIFVWIAASQENSAVALQQGLLGLRVRDAMMTDYQTMDVSDDLGRAVELTLAGTQHDFPVMENERYAGLLTRKSLMAKLAESGRELNVLQAMSTEVPKLEANLPVTEVMPELQACGDHALPVFEKDELVGLLNPENLGELLMIRTALQPTQDTGFIRRD